MLRVAILFVFLGLSAIQALSIDICANEADGTRLPLETDCSKFVVCQERQIHQLGSCPYGLHFNPAFGECDFQWRAGCFAAINLNEDSCSCNCCADTCMPASAETLPTATTDCETDVTTDVTITDETPTDIPTTFATETPSTATPVLPHYCKNNRTDCINKKDGTVLLVEYHCEKYMTCSGGCAIIQNCPSGLHYQINGDFCDHPSNVDCPWKNHTVDNDGEDETTPIPTGPSGTSCEDPDVCRDQPDGTLFADPDSNGYIVCQCGCPLKRPCDEQLVFNEEAQVCDWPFNIDNIGSSDTICPDDLIYNSETDECVYPKVSLPEMTCKTTTNICVNQKEGTVFPVEGSCNKFYICNYNCAVEITCPNNLLYSQELQICLYPEKVKCPYSYKQQKGQTAGSRVNLRLH